MPEEDGASGLFISFRAIVFRFKRFFIRDFFPPLGLIGAAERFRKRSSFSLYS